MAYTDQPRPTSDKEGRFSRAKFSKARFSNPDATTDVEKPETSHTDKERPT
jgi:hypothetical protein